VAVGLRRGEAMARVLGALDSREGTVIAEADRLAVFAALTVLALHFHVVAEGAEGAQLEGADGVRVEAEAGGGLFVGEAGEEAEQDDALLLGGEASNGGAHLGARGAGDDFAFGVDALVGGVEQPVLGGGFTPATAECGHGAVVGDGEQPGDGGGASAEGVALAPGLEVDVGSDVFGCGGIVHEGAGVAVDGVEGLFVEAPEAFGRIGQVLGLGIRGGKPCHDVLLTDGPWAGAGVVQVDAPAAGVRPPSREFLTRWMWKGDGWRSRPRWTAVASVLEAVTQCHSGKKCRSAAT